MVQIEAPDARPDQADIDDLTDDGTGLPTDADPLSDNPGASGWQVKRDGGEFDQFTGATITPRAVVRAVHNTLLYYQANADMIFAQ